MRSRATVLTVLLAAALVAGAVGTAQTQPRPGWPRSVTIGSASIGGVYFVVAGGWARVIGEKMGLAATNRVTGGPVQNIQLVQAKEIELGMTTTGPLYEALQGIGEFAGKKMDAVRVIFPMYTSYAHWMVSADSGIRSVADLSGKVVSLGPRGGSAEFVGERVLQLFNVKPRRIVYLGFADGASAIRDGVVDAAFGVIGVPVPAWVEAAITRPMRFFGFTREQIEVLTSRYPYLARAAIRPGVYRGQDEAIQTVQMWNAAIVHRDMPEDFVYELTKVMLTNREFLATVHPTAHEMLPVNIFYIKMPMHPGAIRYFREQGVTLAPEHIPPEMKR
ncbi:MAG: TAXI family TRAP transporter solute-binding subunit [Armatimonadota bacterium]|nr:TAXI family TRAP transporter solute-binding subunit [Armatimonadota bacterium]MDR7402023.1 TAXI family TRAP transporter solute-binding subunit [Armatimonadota bacterium]MDR7404505.1 TAXI family TRAP transporter solute-binding subunit [Armatimonadota bacterium]MDR7438245.1 TAXI family TRAP transporter solute-binding subunit [Armatimonadota bacterium]MDR7473082.1 TAXI family TRAP transporter solute-binding subunit [Armatimonadota bacterium]